MHPCVCCHSSANNANSPAHTEGRSATTVNYVHSHACTHQQMVCVHPNTKAKRLGASIVLYEKLKTLYTRTHTLTLTLSLTISPRHAKQLPTRPLVALPHGYEHSTHPPHSPMFAPTSQTTSPGRKLTPCWRYTLWVRMRDIVDRYD